MASHVKVKGRSIAMAWIAPMPGIAPKISPRMLPAMMTAKT